MRSTTLLLAVGAVVAASGQAAATGFGTYTLPAGTATSVPGGPYQGFSGVAYTGLVFDVKNGTPFQGAWASSAYGYTGDPAKDWLAIPAGNNGGNFYSDADASNITLRVFFQNVDLTGINNITIGHQGSATLGVRNADTSGFNLDPQVAGLAIYDQTQGFDWSTWPPTPSSDLNDTQRSYLFQTWMRDTGYIGDIGHGPDAGWNGNAKGGPAGNDPSYDTFDVILEFAPQADGTVRMYAMERIHKTWDVYSNGIMKWNTHDYNWNGVHHYYCTLPLENGGDFMDEVYVFAAAGNGPVVTTSGGNSIAWDPIVTGTLVPEPVTMAGMLLGVGSLVGYVRRRWA